MRLLITCAIGAALFASACGGDSKKTSTATPAKTALSAEPTSAATSAATKSASTTPAATTSTATTPAAAPTQGGGKKTYSAAPPLTIDANKKYFATIKMDIGEIKLELYPKEAPQHVNNFVFLAKEGYYDGVTFHRVIPGFVAQAGDPSGKGSGGPGYTIPDEVNSHKFVDGTLGMAKTAAPNSAGSQWFIDLTPRTAKEIEQQSALDGGYTVFGQLVSGHDVLDKIKPRDPSTPTAPGTVINSIVIEEQ